MLLDLSLEAIGSLVDAGIGLVGLSTLGGAPLSEACGLFGVEVVGFLCVGDVGLPGVGDVWVPEGESSLPCILRLHPLQPRPGWQKMS